MGADPARLVVEAPYRDRPPTQYPPPLERARHFKPSWAFRTCKDGTVSGVAGSLSGPYLKPRQHGTRRTNGEPLEAATGNAPREGGATQQEAGSLTYRGAILGKRAMIRSNGGEKTNGRAKGTLEATMLRRYARPFRGSAP